MAHRADARHSVEELEATSELVDGRIALYAPRPGYWRGAPPEGALVRPGMPIGELEILGEVLRLRAPADAFGVVGGLPEGRWLARRPVDRATRLMLLDPEGVSGAEASELGASRRAGAEGPVFRSPLGGRYYAQPAPDADPFVAVGDELAGGETVALIEVMKTFNRVKYTGAPARVVAIAPKDGDDLENGDVILELEAIS
jgi:acetyl-CoA carboxylase biotin carboxyl carrier protein